MIIRILAYMFANLFLRLVIAVLLDSTTDVLLTVEFDP